MSSRRGGTIMTACQLDYRRSEHVYMYSQHIDVSLACPNPYCDEDIGISRGMRDNVAVISSSSYRDFRVINVNSSVQLPVVTNKAGNLWYL